MQPNRISVLLLLSLLHLPTWCPAQPEPSDRIKRLLDNSKDPFELFGNKPLKAPKGKSIFVIQLEKKLDDPLSQCKVAGSTFELRDPKQKTVCEATVGSMNVSTVSSGETFSTKFTLQTLIPESCAPRVKELQAQKALSYHCARPAKPGSLTSGLVPVEVCPASELEPKGLTKFTLMSTAEIANKKNTGKCPCIAITDTEKNIEKSQIGYRVCTYSESWDAKSGYAHEIVLAIPNDDAKRFEEWPKPPNHACAPCEQ